MDQSRPLPALFTLSLLLLSIATATTDGSSAVGSSTRSVDNSVFLHVRRIDFFTGPSQLTLECDSGASGNVKFWRELNGLTEQVTVTGDGPNSSRTQITFSVTPEREGSYYCTGDDDRRSEPSSVEIVAYPLQNQTIKSIKSLTARLHGDITLPCVFTPGALSHRYSVHWFRGLTQLDTTNTMRYTVTRDFDLVISGVDALDASDAYYCVVDIENMLPRFTQGYHEIGPSIELIVTDTLSITHPPSHFTDLPSSASSAHFTCSAYGLPPPSITWLYQGSKVTSTSRHSKVYSPPANTTMDREGAMVTRELSVVGLSEDNSGLVECLVWQTREDNDVTIISSSTSLTVIPSSFKPRLLPTSAGVEITITLPTLLPSSFSLLTHFYDTSGTLVGKSLLVSPSFANTRHVDYVIGPEELPLATVFSVKVAVVVGEMEGELSEVSNEITVTELDTPNISGACDCSGFESINTDSTAQTVLIFFVVLLILLLFVAVGVAIWGVVMVIKKMRGDSHKDYLSERSYSPSHSSYRSRSRSRSRSHSRSRSGSHSSRYSRSPSRASYRSESKSQTHSNEQLGVASGGVARGRQDREGSFATEEYLALNNAPPADIGSRSGSVSSCVTNSVMSRPLPSAPYQQRDPAHNDQENTYEELQFKKKQRAKKGAGDEGVVGGCEGVRGRAQTEVEGCEGVRVVRGEVVEEGEWVVVKSVCQKKRMDPALEEVSTV